MYEKFASAKFKAKFKEISIYFSFLFNLPVNATHLRQVRGINGKNMFHDFFFLAAIPCIRVKTDSNKSTSPIPNWPAVTHMVTS